MKGFPTKALTELTKISTFTGGGTVWGSRSAAGDVPTELNRTALTYQDERDPDLAGARPLRRKTYSQLYVQNHPDNSHPIAIGDQYVQPIRLNPGQMERVPAGRLSEVYAAALTSIASGLPTAFSESHDVSSELVDPVSLAYREDNRHWYVWADNGDLYAYEPTWGLWHQEDLSNLTPTASDVSAIFYRPNIGRSADTSGLWYVLDQADTDIWTEYRDWGSAQSGTGYDVGGETSSPVDLWFRYSNSQWYVLDGPAGSATVYEYNDDPSLAGDYDNFGYTGNSWDLTSEDTQPVSLFFREELQKWFVLGQQNGNLYEYEADWTYTGNSYNLSGEDGTPIAARPRAGHVLVAGQGQDAVHEYIDQDTPRVPYLAK